MDVLSPEQRRLNMSRIRGRDTKPELLLRRGLHATGLRFRLHAKDLPGRPDIVFPRHRALVLVHGCFWHGHDCPMFKLPATRTDFWEAKIGGNKRRDLETGDALRIAGWRILTAWECALRGPARKPAGEVVGRVRAFILGDDADAEIQGNWSARREREP